MIVKPVFSIETGQVIQIIEGQSKTLNLNVGGNPNHISYTLYMEGMWHNLSSLSINNGILEMSAISRTDIGSYALKAENSEGLTFHNFTINVTCKIFFSCA